MEWIIQFIGKFFSSQINATWATAIGTLALAIVTVIIHLLGDKYTRVMINIQSLEFKKIAYDFLKTSYCSWGTKSNAPVDPNKEKTVEENILDFQNKLLNQSVYLNRQSKCKAEKYISLAKNHASSWDSNSGKLMEKYQQKILKEMERLAYQIGKIKSFENFKKKHGIN